MTSNNRQQRNVACARWTATLVLAALLAACGGGGSTSNLSGSSSGSSGSSSSGSSGGGSSGASIAVNVAAVTIDAGPTITAADGCSSAADVAIGGCTIGQAAGTTNIPYVSVTICAPGSTTNCQTIDHITVDTGSSGLRIISTAITSSALLSALTPATNNAGNALTECLQFGSGYMWGSVRTADVHIPTTASGAQELASGVNIQIAGDTPANLAPSACNSLPSLNDVYAAGTNGFLGVGLFLNDCVTGGTCAVGYGYYFTCPTGATTCSEVDVEANHQVANPVAALAASDGGADNLGVVLELPAFSSTTGVPTLTGSLVFGVNNRSNNTLSTAQKVILSDGNGNMDAQLDSPTSYGGTGSLPDSPYSFFDSGSNGVYLPGTSIPCSASLGGWFVPGSTLTYSATVQGASDSYAANPPPVSASLTFLIGNATALFSTSNAAFNDLGAPTGTCSTSTGTGPAPGSASPNGGIDFGIPALLGQDLYVVLETTSFTLGSVTYYGPLWAF